MMRIAILSDIHVEKAPWQPPPIDADLVVLAGDIGWGEEGVGWAASALAGHLADKPAVYIAGNREHWRHPPGADPRGALRRAAASVPNLHFLQDDEIIFTIKGRALRVLGATLWSDYALEGDSEGAMEVAERTMPDYRNGNGSDGNRLTVRQVRDWNRASVDFLADRLAVSHDGPTMVVTHHAPSAQSLKHRRPDHVPTTASVTSLEPLIQSDGPALWVHGHTHWDCDYPVGGTRILSNQRGGPENETYRPMIATL